MESIHKSDTSGVDAFTLGQHDAEAYEAIVTICVMAAFADGDMEAGERERLREVFTSMGTSFSPEVYRSVIMGEAKLEEVASRVNTPAMRRLAYEMAVGMCDVDGKTVPAEQAFLDRLRVALGLEASTTKAINEEGETLASLATADVTVWSEDSQGTSSAQDAELDSMILKYAILNGGLELLPQSLATMAIVPLQMKMVYRIGERLGYSLDQGHVKDLLAVVGIGMTSQVMETYARKLMGSFLKKAIGKKKGKKMAKVTGAATGAVMSFASTYALGQVAKTYYADGRQLAPETLKRLFAEQVSQGKTMFDTYRSEVEASARNTDLSSLMRMVAKRG